MAKKSYRARQRPARPIVLSPSAPQVAPAAEEVRASTDVVAAAMPKRQVDFASEYRYVLGDLRKMGIIAVAMFVVLIALSFAVR
jgi:hypothetical protein